MALSLRPAIIPDNQSVFKVIGKRVIGDSEEYLESEQYIWFMKKGKSTTMYLMNGDRILAERTVQPGKENYCQNNSLLNELCAKIIDHEDKEAKKAGFRYNISRATYQHLYWAHECFYQGNFPEFSNC